MPRVRDRCKAGKNVSKVIVAIATECILLLAVCGVVSAAEPVFVGRVVSFHDGDTLTALDPTNVEHRVLPAGVRGMTGLTC